MPASPPQDVVDWQYTGNRLHPTQKPVGALRPFVETSARKAAWCSTRLRVGFDAGGGRPGGRDFIGIELERAHYYTACRRLRMAA